MTEFVSDIKNIAHSDEDVFQVLSDLSKLELVKDKIPTDKLQDFAFDSDSCSFRIGSVGAVKFVIVAREPNKLVKLRGEDLPFEVNLWIQLVQKSPKETKMKMTLRADLNPFIKPMVSKPMREAINKISEMLSQIPYDKVN